jgi:hypothetical protein
MWPPKWSALAAIYERFAAFATLAIAIKAAAAAAITAVAVAALPGR